MNAKWVAVSAALADARKQLDGRWPEPIRRPRMGGYSQERGRRPVPGRVS